MRRNADVELRTYTSHELSLRNEWNGDWAAKQHCAVGAPGVRERESESKKKEILMRLQG